MGFAAGQAAAPTPPAQDERFGIVGEIMQRICELDADNPDDPQTICINVDQLQRIIKEEMAESARPAQEAEPVACPKCGTECMHVSIPNAWWHKCKGCDWHSSPTLFDRDGAPWRENSEQT
jgi:hypothetical protein